MNKAAFIKVLKAFLKKSIGDFHKEFRDRKPIVHHKYVYQIVNESTIQARDNPEIDIKMNLAFIEGFIIG